MAKESSDKENKAIEMLKKEFIPSRVLNGLLEGKKGRVKAFIQKIEGIYLLAEDYLDSGETTYKIICDEDFK